MRFTPEHDQFRRTVRDLVEREINPHVDEWEAAGTFPAHELFPKLAAAGVLGLEYDPEFGGGGADATFTAVYGEEIGRCDSAGVALAISVQTDMATPSLSRFGSADLKERYLRPALAGTQVAAIAVTEADAGSDVAGIRTRAVRDGDEWVINGSKLYITNGTQADWLCLLARSDEGYSQIVVPTDVDGFSVSRSLPKLGNRASDTAELAFTDVRVPVANTIGEIGSGFRQQMAQFQDERLICAHLVAGAARGALDRTIAYVKDRPVFGRTLADQQWIQYRLAELIAQHDLVLTYNRATAEAVAEGADTTEMTRMASIAKLQATRHVREVADWCLQFHGGAGYLEETWTARFFRDARLLSIGAGADEVMLRIIARIEGISGANS